MTPAAKSTPALPDAEIAVLEAGIEALRTGARFWTGLTLRQRITLLERVREAVGAVAEEWADVAKEISGRTNIPVVVYPDASHHVEPTNADVEAKLRELSLI